ncbi:MAG: hypothetical protein KME17_04615 [Cyanosarcina radialis HA8281-LM2]|jgi:hypothetical protein|nr:hypothetical protein [Cyanosarcina radialis HA8281-LM2]
MSYQTPFLSLMGSMAIAVSIVSLPGYTQTPSAEKQLLGTWETTIEEQQIKFVFTPDNQLFMIPSDRRAKVFILKYQLNTQTKPMQLDVIHGRQKVLTIFEFTDNNKLRVETDNLAPGKPRPTAFSPESRIFNKVSNSTVLPANVRVEKPQFQS